MTATTPPASRDNAERLVEIRDRLSRGDLTYSRHEELATLFIAIDDRDASLAAANAELDGARAEISTLRKQLADAEIDANTEAEPELARLRSAAPSDDLRAVRVWKSSPAYRVQQQYGVAPPPSPDAEARGTDAETAPERLALGYCPIHQGYHRNAWCEHHYGAGPLNPENAPPSPEAGAPYPGETYLAHQDEWNGPAPPDRTELNAWLEIAENTRKAWAAAPSAQESSARRRSYQPTRYLCKVHGEQVSGYRFQFGKYARLYCPKCMMALWDKHCEQLIEAAPKEKQDE